MTMDDRDTPNVDKQTALGEFLKSARKERDLTLRQVEEVTNKEVSNAYLSQLETGKISKPAPHVLYALSAALSVPYEDLMRRAGYLKGPGPAEDGAKHGKAATRAIENLTPDEEKALLDHLSFIRWQRTK
jgi:transcriptional regulator with XRE-family HTH domain